MARQMVTMMAGINKQYFGGRQVVTCFTCHRGSNRPKVTASLDDPVRRAAAGRARRARSARRRRAARPRSRSSTSTSQAIGGAQRAADADQLRRQGDVFGLRAGRRFPRPVEIYAQGAEPEDGDRASIRQPATTSPSFNGTAGWVSAPFKPLARARAARRGARFGPGGRGADLPGQRQDAAHRHADEQRLHRRPHGARRAGQQGRRASSRSTSTRRRGC